MIDDRQRVALRKQELERLVAQLRHELTEAQDELQEIIIAERVLSRLSGEQGGKARPVNQLASSLPASEKPATVKPKGTPTVPDMILAVLGEAKVNGRLTMEPKDITAEIARLWWPEAKSDKISSITWRMWKRDQLRKEGSSYGLPEKTEAADGSLWGSVPAASNNPQAGRLEPGREVAHEKSLVRD